jgi:hypothetical protein
VNRERYQQLLDQLLEGELPAADADELVRGLRENPAFQNDLRRHLVLWEMWSQKVARERSSEAFIEGWKTRVAAETEAEPFVHSVQERIRTLEARPVLRVSFWRRWLRPLPVALAIFAAAFLTLASWRVHDQIAQRNAARENTRVLSQLGVNQLVTLTGEGVCAWCVLREGPPQRPAIRVKLGGGIKIVYLVFPRYSQGLHQYFTGGTSVQAKGILQEDHGRLLLRTQSLVVNGAEYR